MIIGIDGNEANVRRKVGISEYAYELLLEFNKLKKLSGDNKFIIYLKAEPLDDLPKPDSHWEYRVIKPGKFWTQWRLPLDLYLHKPRPDVFFSLTHYSPRFSPVPTVVSIMDLSYLYFPEMFKKSDLYQLRAWTSYSVKKAKHVLTISNSTKFDIIKEYKISAEKITVIYPGIKQSVCHESKESNMDNLKTKYGIKGDYILFVGTLQPRKNISRLIEAFAKVGKKDLDLVIIGKKGWLYEEILNKPKELGLEDCVKFLHEVEDDELALFYKHAQAFVLPSLYEGFGLPVLEAMQHGCPVITSNVSSLHEAGGDAAVYVDPLDVNDIAEKIKKVISSPQLQKELKEKGKKQLAKFSWEKTGKDTLKILEEVAQAK